MLYIYGSQMVNFKVQYKASDHTMNGFKYNAVLHSCRVKREMKFSLLFDLKETKINQLIGI